MLSGFGDRSIISVSSPTKEVLFVNENYLSLIGWREQDIVGRSWEQLMPTEAAQQTRAPFAEFLTTKRPYQIATKMLCRDNSTVDVLASCSVLKGKSAVDDLVFTEFQKLADDTVFDPAAQVDCAELVRDVTYELAALTGRNKLRQLTDALIEASGCADKVIALLSRVPGLTDELDR